MPLNIKRTGPQALALGWVVVSLAALVPVVGPIMHESDQASLLFGAERLARGLDSMWAANFYNYDKQYLTYWLLAVARRLFPGVDPVSMGNWLSFSIFWGGVLAIVLRRPVRRYPQATALGACLLAPALWLHSPFLGTNSVSFGFLLFAWAAWASRGGSRPRRLLALLGVGCAVAARADALLILPWLAWTVTSAGQWRSLGRRPAPLWIAAAGLAALLLGRVLYTGEAVYTNLPYFSAKIYAAYLIFGLGAAAGTFLWLAIALLATASDRWRRHRSTAPFYLAGLLALLLPWAFYSMQLFSTRYWTPLLAALIGGLLTRRGRMLVTWPRCPRMARLAATALLIGTVAPLFVGVHLPFPRRPRLVLSDPTLFPTGDGFQPMGALGPFLRALAGNPDHVVDHNQATWLSATSAKLQSDASGKVPILQAPLQSYLLLAVTLRGLQPQIVSDQAPRFYTDARDLLRIFNTPDRLRPLDRRSLSRTLHVTRAGPEIDGYGIIQADHTIAPEAAWLARLDLAQAFHGNEYRLRPDVGTHPDFILPRRDEGKTVVLYSPGPFAVAVQGTDGVARPVAVGPMGDTPLYVATVPGRAWWGTRFVVTRGEPQVAIAVHPDYMNEDQL